MKIYIVARGCPSNKYIMNGIFEFDQAKALTARGHEVVYLAVDLRSIRRWRKWGFETLVKDNVKIKAVNIPLGRFPKKILHFFGIIGLTRVYKKAIKEFGKPDIIHAHFTESAYLSVKTLSKTNVPIVMTEHSSAITENHIDPKLRKIAEYTYPNMKEIFVVSPALQNRIKEEFNIESKYLPNIVDVSLFSYKEKEEDHTTFKVVSIGALIHRKRMKKLIEGFALFSHNYPDSMLEIFGDGPERADIEEIIRTNDMTSSVYLRGEKSRKVIAESLEQADCFALVTANETFGVVYIEALACGVPVIATRCGGPEGFVNEGNGLLIPVDDNTALVDAFTHMYKNSSNYNRAMIAREISDKFSPEVIATELENTYKEILAREAS